MTPEVVIRRALLATGALLALFHVWLFAGQAWDGRLADPALILRWLIAFALVAGLIGLRRQGTSIVRGRKAVSIWLLAALLHGPAAVNRLDGLGEPALPEFVATLTQIAVASGAVFGLAWTLARLRARRAVLVAFERLQVVRNPRAGHSSAHAFVRFAPRPPPLFV